MQSRSEGPAPALVMEIAIGVDADGLYRATASFGHSLSESDPRPEFSLQHRWSRIRRRSRDALVARMARDLQTTGEALQQAERRIRASLGRLVVVDQDVDAQNRWHGVSFKEAP